MIAYEIVEAEQASGKPAAGTRTADTGDALQALMDLQNERKRRGL